VGLNLGKRRNFLFLHARCRHKLKEKMGPIGPRAPIFSKLSGERCSLSSVERSERHFLCFGSHGPIGSAVYCDLFEIWIWFGGENYVKVLKTFHFF